MMKKGMNTHFLKHYLLYGLISGFNGNPTANPFGSPLTVTSVIPLKNNIYL